MIISELCAIYCNRLFTEGVPEFGDGIWMGIFTDGIDLVASDEIRDVLTELLAARKVPLNPSSPFAAVEKGLPIPEGKTAVVFEWSRIHRLFELLGSQPQEGSADGAQKSVIGKTENDTMEIIPYSRVCFFEARGNFVFCVTPLGEYKVKEKLYELESTLPVDRFIRVSRSFIVNIENVSQIVPWFGRRLVLRFSNTKKEVEVSKNYATAFKDFLGL